MCTFGVFSLSTFALVGVYFYVAAAAIKAARKGESEWGAAITKGLTWPATIWTTTSDKYDLG